MTIKERKEQKAREIEGLCNVLFKYIPDRPCPFYKSRARIEAETEALKNEDIDAYFAAAKIDMEE